MHTITRTQEGVLELNYMWLPTWIGMNAKIKRDLEKAIGEKVVGLELTQETLEMVNEMVIDYLVESHPHVSGLQDYLDGLKFVKLADDDSGKG